MKAKQKVVTVIPISTLLDEYDELRERKKQVEKRLSYLSDQIKAYAEANGVKDDKGSFYASDDKYIYGKQAKKSVSFDKEKAMQFFKAHKFTDCIDTVEVINEDAVEARISSGDISYEELESITVTKTTYAIDVKKKEEMPEVEETIVSLAASKKPKLSVPHGGKK